MDTAAALAGLRAGLSVHLVFPHGFRQEDGALTPKRRDALPGATLHELASPEFRYRTWTCVYLSDAVILIDPAGGDGCRETIRAASHLGRPLLDLSAELENPQLARPISPLARPEPLASWLASTRPHVLMVAGCRSSVLAARGLTASPGSPLDALLTVIADQFASATKTGPGVNRPAG